MGCFSSLWARAVRSEADALASSVSWPFTRFGSILVSAKITILVAAVVVGALLCHESETCSGRAWDEDFWGDREANDEYCERYDPNKFMQETANSLSNLAFCAAGLLIMACGFADAFREGSLFPLLRARSADEKKKWRVSHILDWPVASILLGLFTALQGVFSFFFHAHGTKLTQQLDVGIMFLILSTMAAIALAFCFDSNSKRLLLIRTLSLGLYTTLGLVCFIYKYSVPTTELTLALIGAAILGVLVGLLRRNSIGSVGPLRKLLCLPEHGLRTRVRFKRLSLLALCIVTFGGAFVVRGHGVSKKSCVPDSVFQFHALWHVMAGAAVLFQYLFVRSERSAPREDSTTAINVVGML